MYDIKTFVNQWPARPGKGMPVSMVNLSALALPIDRSSEVEALQVMLRRWVDENLAPVAAQIDRENRFARELWPELGKLGFHGITVPEMFGGAGFWYLAHVVAVGELARGSASAALSYGSHSSLCVNQITLNGTEEQKASTYRR